MAKHITICAGIDTGKHKLDVALDGRSELLQVENALEGFGATDSYAIGQLGPENARDAFARIDRPEIEVFVVPGGNFPTMTSIAAWEQEFAKPVVTTNQASFWAMLRAFNTGERIPTFGRLLQEVPAG